MLFKKKKQFNIPKNAFEGTPKHRFTFVAEGWCYFEGYSVQISSNITSKEKAFYIATEMFFKKFSDSQILNNVAVFYGDVEAPDCQDKLFRAYNHFEKHR